MNKKQNKETTWLEAKLQTTPAIGQNKFRYYPPLTLIFYSSQTGQIADET